VADMYFSGNYETPSVPSEFLLSDSDSEFGKIPGSYSHRGRYDLLISSSDHILTPSQKPWVNEQTLLIYEQRINITNRFNIPAYDLELTVMLMPKDLPGYQVVFEESIWPMTSEIVELPDGNRYAIIRCSSLWPGENLLVTVTYNLVNTSWETDKSRLHLYTEAPTDLLALASLQAESKVESDHPDIIAMARRITGLETNPFRKAELIYTWVNLNLIYDEDEAYAHQGAYSALVTRRGVCTEYAALFAALLRASGIPARLTGGYLLQNSSLTRSEPLYDGELLAHTWAEFYLEGFGWVPCEPTYELIENGLRYASLKYFAALPHWGHVVTSCGLSGDDLSGRQYNLSYSGFRDMLIGTVSSSFQIGQRLLGNEIKVYLNDWDQRINFLDALPRVLPAGVTVLPFRRVFEILGADVLWNNEERSILARTVDSNISLHLDSPVITVNGEDQVLLAAPFIDLQSERTMVPLRAISEGLGASVYWDPTWRSVLIIP